MYFKKVDDGYIKEIGTSDFISGSLEEITVSEYDEILTLIQNKPAETDTLKYRLKTDLTWEEYEVEPPEPSEDVDDSEALEILLGGGE